MIDRLQLWLAAIAAFFAAFVAAYLRGRSDGSGATQSRQAQQSLDAMRTRQEVDDDVAKQDDASVGDALSEWVRDSHQQ